MGRCPYEQLSDIELLLAEVRKLPKIKEPKPGIFYLKSQGFLHFHLKDNRRWADVRDGKGWGSEIEIPIKSTKASTKYFIEEVKRRYQTLV
jgi:hypothetical protein